MKKQLGISLTEVLISLFLASIIMTTLIQFYLGSKHQYREAEKILATGFEVQWVDNLLSDSIRRAGFTPCLGLDQLHVVDQRNPQNNIHAVYIENQSHQLIRVSRMKEHFAKLIKIESPTKLLVEHSIALNEKRPLLIADCEHAEIHELFSIHQQTNETWIMLSKPITYSYEKFTYVGEFLEEHWFIKKNAQGKNTLHYRWVHTEEVTPLIHSLYTEKHYVQNKQFLQITLGLEHDSTHKLMILVRGT